MSDPRITAIQPPWAVEGGRVSIEGRDLVDGMGEGSPPEVHIGSLPARVVSASSRSVSVTVPAGLDGGRTVVRIGEAAVATGFLDVGRPVATGVHQVDNPVIDGDGTLFVTYSGPRGERSPRQFMRSIRISRAFCMHPALPGRMSMPCSTVPPESSKARKRAR